MRRVPVHLERTFRHPPELAFPWLTDYEDADAELAGELVAGRPSVERQGNVVTMTSLIRTPWGVRERIQEVTLDPEARTWESRIDEGYGAGSHHRYRLEPAGQGSRLVIDYGFAAPRLRDALYWRAVRPVLRRKLHRMWDGFEAGMDRELTRPGGGPR